MPGGGATFIAALFADNDNKRTCPTCGGEITGHRNKKHCTPECKPSRVRDRAADWERRNAKEPVRQCEHCCAEYQATPSKGSPRRFCSVDCRNASVAAVRSLRVSSGRVSYTVYRPLCDNCGERFSTRTSGGTCSEECKREIALARLNEKNKSAAQPKARCKCKECGATFTPAYGDKRERFCSHPCCKRHNGRIARGRREARMRSVANDNVNPFIVFERDGWRCRLCQVDTPRELRGTYASNAPELDHVMPISKGGSHTYENTQLLCRSCNGAKSDRIIPANDNTNAAQAA